jgi:hypothetical protein
MLAYEFYYRDDTDRSQLIGILPERRKDPQRITSDSVMNWVGKVLGDKWDISKIIFVKVMIDNKTGEIV